MSDPSSTTSATSTGSKSGSSELTSLETPDGTTSIAESVVAKIASLAAQEVEGVASLGGSIAGALAGVVGRIKGDEHKTAGVGVEVGTKQAAVDISMTASYPASINQVAEGVRRNVIERIQNMTGLEVVEVNIAVIDLAFPGSEDEAPTGRVE